MIDHLLTIPSRLSRYMLPLFVCGAYLFLYIPIFVLIIFSFNSAQAPVEWGGMSLKWYKALFLNSEIWIAFKNSLIVAFSAVVLSVSMSVLVIYGARTMLDRVLTIFYGSVLLPEVVLGVGLLSLFYFLSVPLGLTTLIAGHTVLGLGFVIPIVHARFDELDKYIEQAALDLGASQLQTFWYVIIPFLAPSLVVASLLVLIVSFDDFLISFFCAGATTQTLSLYIFAMIRSGVSPIVNALSVFILLGSSVIVLLFSSSKIQVMDKQLP